MTVTRSGPSCDTGAALSPSMLSIVAGLNTILRMERHVVMLGSCQTEAPQWNGSTIRLKQQYYHLAQKYTQGGPEFGVKGGRKPVRGSSTTNCSRCYWGCQIAGHPPREHNPLQLTGEDLLATEPPRNRYACRDWDIDDILGPGQALGKAL